MGIRDRLAAHDARLVSVSELLTAIANAEGVTLQEVARALHLDGITSSVRTWLRIYRNAAYVYEKGGDAAVKCELEYAADGEDAMISDDLRDDADQDLQRGEPGFFREDIVTALKTAGWDVPPCLTEPMTTVVKNERDLRPFIQRTQITLDEAAMLLKDANGWEWRPTLEKAANTRKIRSSGWVHHRGAQQLSHADVRAWCEDMGIIWPVPLPPEDVLPATDTELREALAKAQAECHALKLELAQSKAESSFENWTLHDTRLFKLLPSVIEMARKEQTWPKQEVFIGELMTKFNLTQADAKALDAVTRPDELRRK